MALTVIKPSGIDTTGSYTVTGMTVSANLIAANANIANLITTTDVNFSSASSINLGSVSNLYISGGTANYVLSTDGSGNLSWVEQSGGGGGTSIANGTSNINIPVADGNIEMSVAGNASVLVVTGTGANITGNLNVTGTAILPNIVTGVGSGGTISGVDLISTNTLSVTGNANVGNINATNAVLTNISGNGSGLTSLTGANVTGAVAYATVANSVAVANVTGIGNISTVNLDGNSSNVLYGNGSFAAPTGGGGTPGGSDTQIQYNSSGTFAGNASLTFNESNSRLTVSNLTIGTGFTLSTGTSLGVLYRNSVGEVVTGANLTFNGDSLFVSGGVTADDFYGNLRNGSSNVRIIANSNVNISSAGNANIVVVTGTGANIAGTLNVTGNANVGNIGATNGVFTNISGNGSALTSLTGANVTGTVANANYAAYAGDVVNSTQSNITSLGTLTGLTSNGVVNFTNASNVSLGAVGNLKITGGTANYVLSTDGSGNLSWVEQSGGGGGTPGGSNTQLQFNDDGSFGGNAGLTFDKTTTTLTANNLIATSTANLGDVGNLTITGGSYGYVLSTDGAGTLGWSQQAQAASITVDTFTGNGVQTEFTLSTTPLNANTTIVNYNGAVLLRGTYTISGANITFGSAPANGASIEVTTMGLTNGGSSIYSRTSIAAAAGQTTFAVAYAVGYIQVYLNGILLANTDYTASNGTTVVLASAASLGDIVEFMTFNTMPVQQTPPATFNSTNLTSNLAITAGYSAVSVGPINIAEGVTISIADGQKWVIL